MAYTNSPLVTYTNLNRNGHSNGRRADKIDIITIHCYVAQVTAQQGCDAFAGRTDASCNYVVGKNGGIGLCVEEKNRSWCSGGNKTVNGITGGNNDERAITIEVASDVNFPWAITDAAYQSLIALVADIAQRNGMGQLKWLADPSLVGFPDKQNMTVHRWFANKACPGDYIFERLGTIADEANKLLGNPSNFAQLVASLNLGGGLVKHFTPRLTCPERGNPYYNTPSAGGYSPCILGKPTVQGLNVLRNCVGYALGRFNEIGEYGSCKYLKSVNAANFIRNCGGLDYGPTPKLGACIVWSGGSSGAGHVGIVEQINADGSIVTSESGWEAGSDFWTKTRPANRNWGAGSRYTFLGFIYNPAVTDDMVSVGGLYATSLGFSSAPRPATWADLGLEEENVNPFVATIDPNDTDIDYEGLKSIKVSGLMLFAGQMYEESSHKPRAIFRASNLKKQVAGCLENEMQFALYTRVLARTVEEAKQELNQLYYTISRYPPGMGIWLQLGFRQSQKSEMNSKILDTYLEYFEKWGLASGCGLYATPEELSKIDWETYSERFLLWLRDPVEDDSELAQFDESILNPTFFKLPEVIEV